MDARGSGAGSSAGDGNGAWRRRDVCATASGVGGGDAALRVGTAGGTCRRRRVRALCLRAARGPGHRHREGGWDAVYLSLHGAAITTVRQTPDLDLVREVRSLLPRIPLGASFDLHGNMAPEFAALLDVASVYRTHPHVDMADTAARVLDGRRPRALRRGRTADPPRAAQRSPAAAKLHMRTSAGPMRELEDAARAATTGGVLEVAVFGGFPYSDTVHTGASVFIVSDACADQDGLQAERAAAALTISCGVLPPRLTWISRRRDRRLRRRSPTGAAGSSPSPILPTIHSPVAAATRRASSARCSTPMPRFRRSSQASPTRRSLPRRVRQASVRR